MSAATTATRRTPLRARGFRCAIATLSDDLGGVSHLLEAFATRPTAAHTRHSCSASTSGCVPPDLDDITVRVAKLHAHVVRLVPPVDDVESVRLDAIPKRAHLVRARGTATKVQERRQHNRLIDLAERERESAGVVEN